MHSLFLKNLIDPILWNGVDFTKLSTQSNDCRPLNHACLVQIYHKISLTKNTSVFIDNYQNELDFKIYNLLSLYFHINGW